MPLWCREQVRQQSPGVRDGFLCRHVEFAPVHVVCELEDSYSGMKCDQSISGIMMFCVRIRSHRPTVISHSG